MTLRFKFKYYSDVDELLDVSVSRDKEITFNDRDIEYETAFEAMGGRQGTATLFLGTWKQDIWGAVCLMIQRDNMLYGRFLTDCVDHAFSIYRDNFPDNDTISTAILVVRNYYISPGQSEHSKVWVSKVWLHELTRYATFDDRPTLTRMGEAAYRMSNVATSCYGKFGTTYISDMVIRAIEYCADAVGFMYAIKHGATFGKATSNESVWQWHRFYDIMTELQAGRDWPSMEATP